MACWVRRTKQWRPLRRELSCGLHPHTARLQSDSATSLQATVSNALEVTQERGGREGGRESVREGQREGERGSGGRERKMKAMRTILTHSLLLFRYHAKEWQQQPLPLRPAMSAVSRGKKWCKGEPKLLVPWMTLRRAGIRSHTLLLVTACKFSRRSPLFWTPAAPCPACLRWTREKRELKQVTPLSARKRHQSAFVPVVVFVFLAFLVPVCIVRGRKGASRAPLPLRIVSILEHLQSL